LVRRFRVSVWLSVLASTIWLSLPINSEAVAWISGRSYCLVMTFLLLSVLAADLYRTSGKLCILSLYAITAFASLLSHEIAILIVPFTLLRTSKARRGGDLSAVFLRVVSFLVGAMYLILRWRSGAAVPGGIAIWPVGLAFLKYIEWMILPIRMSVERSTDTPPNNGSSIAFVSFVVLIILSSAVFLLRKRAPLWAASMTWLGISLVPFSGIVFLYQGMAERYDYVASLGFVVAVLALQTKGPTWFRGLFLFLIVSWSVWGVWRVRSRVLDWRDEKSLYASSLEATPNSAVLHFNLGRLCELAGDFDSAFTRYSRAHVLMRDYANPIAGIANTYLHRGEPRLAVAAYQEALAIDPDSLQMRVNLGGALQAIGDIVGAEQQYRQAIALYPKRGEPYAGLGILMMREGELDLAIDYVRKSIVLNPLNHAAWMNLGQAYRLKGDLKRAIETFAEAEQIESDSHIRQSQSLVLPIK
jgi:Flp pilus assembly protein TadD